MSAVFKCVLGLIFFMCFVQFIEMARVRRDDKPADIAGDLTNAVNSLVDKLKGALDDDTVKKLMEGVNKALTDGAKTVQEQLANLPKIQS